MDFFQLMTAVATNGIGLVCAAAVLWFAYYRETKTLPQMLATFTESLAAGQKSFETRNAKTLDIFAQITREERETCQKWHEENRNLLHQMLDETKENRHFIRDLANQVGLAKAVEQERKRLGTDKDDDGK